MTMHHKLIKSAAAIIALAAVLPTMVQAHHSTTMFDFTRKVVLTGTIKSFQWTNPHSWTVVTAEGGKAVAGEYGLEGMSPNYLARNGWTKRSLKTGDKVVLEVYPLKDGRKGGFMISAKKSDGTVMYNLPRRPDASPAAAAAAAQGR
jgi:tellurite resistance-related uncharacterized protein